MPSDADLVARARDGVLVAEDQAMVLGALASLLDMEADIEVVGRAADGHEAGRLLGETAPDILLTDIEMPGPSGLDLAERAAAYGAWGRKVDGTDPDIVADAFAEAVAHARAGQGPAILEATAYRFRGHFEGDHDSYRSRAELKRIREAYDPVTLYRRKLAEGGLAEAVELDEITAASKRRMAALLAEVRAEAQPDPAGVFEGRFVEEA